MYHVSAQGVDERMINVHYYYLGQGEGGREVGEGGDYIYIYTYRYTVTTRMTHALRWATMSAILMFYKS